MSDHVESLTWLTDPHLGILQPSHAAPASPFHQPSARWLWVGRRAVEQGGLSQTRYHRPRGSVTTRSSHQRFKMPRKILGDGFLRCSDPKGRTDIQARDTAMSVRSIRRMLENDTARRIGNRGGR